MDPYSNLARDSNLTRATSKLDKLPVLIFKIWYTVKIHKNTSFPRSAHCSFVLNCFKSEISQSLPSWKVRSTHSRSNGLSVAHCGEKFPFLMQFKTAKF